MTDESWKAEQERVMASMSPETRKNLERWGVNLAQSMGLVVFQMMCSTQQHVYAMVGDIYNQMPRAGLDAVTVPGHRPLKSEPLARVNELLSQVNAIYDDETNYQPKE